MMHSMMNFINLSGFF